jgi:hypothetical protein
MIKLLVTLSAFIIFSFGFSRQASAQSFCQRANINKESNHSRVDLFVGGRRVIILGWRHLESNMKIQNAMGILIQSAAKAAEKKDCASAGTALKNLLSVRREQLESGLSLLDRLKSVQVDTHVDTLGVEFSPEEWPSHEKAKTSQAMAVLAPLTNCRQETEPLVKQAALLMPGPEFLIQNSEMKFPSVKPLEDERLRRKSAEIAQEIERLPPLSTHDLKPAVQAIFKKLENHLPLQQSEVDLAFKDQGPNEAGVLAKKYFDAFKRLDGLIPIRDEHMAETILRAKGNFVVVVGSAHAEDLATQIQRKCQVRAPAGL